VRRTSPVAAYCIARLITVMTPRKPGKLMSGAYTRS